MVVDINYIEGQTPLDGDEAEGLRVPSVATRGELDEFEQLNIERAVAWTLGRKLKPERILTEQFVKELHRRMFGDVWRWAGEFRKTNKNIGVDKSLVAVTLKDLFGDAMFWITNETYSGDEIAVRFKHRIVSIHCFANGNGRHARLMADVIASHVFGAPVFTWGSANLGRSGDVRKNYIDAIRKADAGNIAPLIAFARS
jgi:Fic-DOC domain mobile mystery protein B